MPTPRPVRSVTILALVGSALVLGGCRELQDLRQIKSEQDKRLAELQSKLEESTRQQHRQAQESRTQIDALQRQLDATREDLRKAQTLRSQREDQAEAAVAEVRRALAAKENELALNRKALEDLQREIETRDANIKNLTAEAEGLKSSLADTRGQLEARTREKEDLEAKGREADKRIEELTARAATVQGALDKEKGESERLRKELAEARQRGQSLEENARNLSTQLATLQENLKTLSAEKQQTTVELEKQAARLQEQIQKLEAGQTVTDADFQEAYNLLRVSLRPLSDSQFASVTLDRRGVVVRLAADYLFKEGMIDLDAAVLATLDQIAAVYKRFPRKYVEVQGHTDTQAITNLPFADNWALASARADCVVRYLAAQGGLDPKRLKGSSASQYRPLPREQSGPGGRMNRRVEIILTANP